MTVMDEKKQPCSLTEFIRVLLRHGDGEQPVTLTVMNAGALRPRPLRPAVTSHDNTGSRATPLAPQNRRHSPGSSRSAHLKIVVSAVRSRP